MTPAPPPRSTLARIALQRQGLVGKRRIGSGRAGALQVLERLGYVQIDTISVVARAHHHTFWTRAGGYRDAIANQLVQRREAFEYWHHAAALLPMRDYRFALPAMRAYKRGERGEHGMCRCQDAKLLRRVLHQVRAEGPLRARDFEQPRGEPGGWWNWKPAKRALEQLFMQGDIMCVGRDGFEKRYDIAERVLPADAAAAEPTLREQAGHLIDTGLAAHGAATARSFAFGRHSAALARMVRDVLAERARSGELATVPWPGGGFCYAAPETLEERPSKPPTAVRLLSPFDNLVIQRERALALFQFDYTLECYVPEAKRKWGYYCLPILFRDGFAGRMDCKALRDAGRFDIRHLHIEADLPDAFDAAFSAAVWGYARYLGCEAVELRRVTPSRHQQRMRRCLASEAPGG